MTGIGFTSPAEMMEHSHAMRSHSWPLSLLFLITRTVSTRELAGRPPSEQAVDGVMSVIIRLVRVHRQPQEHTYQRPCQGQSSAGSKEAGIAD